MTGHSSTNGTSPATNGASGHRAWIAPDGTRLHYSVSGQGPVLAFCNGLGLDAFIWSAFEPFFKDRFRLLFWDYPGHGASDTPPAAEGCAIQRLPEYLAGILDQEGVDEAVLAGHSFGVQVAMLFACAYPRRAKALVTVCGTPGDSVGHLIPTALSSQLIDLLLPLVVSQPTLTTAAFRGLFGSLPVRQILRHMVTNPILADEKSISAYLYRVSHWNLPVVLRLLKTSLDLTPGCDLHEMSLPVLAIAGEIDPFSPPPLVAQFARQIPDSEFFTVRRGSHLALIDAPDVILLRVEKFFRERVFPEKIVEGTYHPGAEP